jgi:hypothetical protein
VWLDAPFHKVKKLGWVATVVAVGVNQDGQRHALDWDTGPSEDCVFWTWFFRDPPLGICCHHHSSPSSRADEPARSRQYETMLLFHGRE